MYSGESRLNLKDEALKVVRMGEERGIKLRLMGACAILVHCPRYAYLQDILERELSDMDFMSYSEFEPKIQELAAELGYKPIKRGPAFSLMKGRQIFNRQNFIIDVFFDELEMCHKINFRGRLELDYPTITLSDILLEKMQIVQLTEKDVKDTIILIREHEIGEDDMEKVNVDYVTRILSDDWGFYHTVATNLKAVKERLGKYESLTQEDLSEVATKIDGLLSAIDARPKSLKWKMRAKIGTSRKWYQEVEETIR